ncbi:hypothetical protein NLU13_8683 [Sarocladium strictum]|uniref:Uncharacterized protein n=1 Tax=Sarocladium strictum TaxID=5046 RepID=A0AA39GEI9_SARSR|nr:hypothetical protein NLU13_8683 [Sarocladium strictum]
MARNRHLRPRPSTPDLKLALREAPLTAAADPASPPETPTTSPHATRKSSQKPRHQPPPFHDFLLPGLDDSHIRPLGHGHLFSYQPRLGPEGLSPRSASSSSDADDESGSVGSSLHAEANGRSSPEQSEADEQQCRLPDSESESSSDEEGSTCAAATHVETELIVEEIDPMDSDYEGLDTLFPNDIDSERSRSQTRPELDGQVLDHLRKLNCSNEASDDDARSSSSSSSSSLSRDSAEIAFYARQAELKRIRRVSMSSSLGKRTHSEMSGDSDGDSTANDASDFPSSARRMRKRLHRTSLLFQDPPAPRIDELDEPDSSEDERRFAAGLALAHELPYFDIEIVEIESV